MLDSCSSRRASFRVGRQTLTGGRALVFCTIRRAHGWCHSFSHDRHELNARTRLHEIQGADQVRFVALVRRQTSDRTFPGVLSVFKKVRLGSSTSHGSSRIHGFTTRVLPMERRGCRGHRGRVCLDGRIWELGETSVRRDRRAQSGGVGKAYLMSP